MRIALVRKKNVWIGSIRNRRKRQGSLCCRGNPSLGKLWSSRSWIWSSRTIFMVKGLLVELLELVVEGVGSLIQSFLISDIGES